MDHFICVCVCVCMENICGKCEYTGEKKGYKIRMHICYLLIHTFHTDTKTKTATE